MARVVANILIIVVLIVAAAAIAFIITGFSLDGIFASLNTELRETYEHEAPMGSDPNEISFFMDNPAGSVLVDNELVSSSNLYEITTEVWTNDRGSDKYQVNEWKFTDTGGVVGLTFDDQIVSGPRDRIEFRHVIHLNPDISIESFDVDVSAGGIDVILADTTLNNPNLDVSAGGASMSITSSNITGELIMDVSAGGLDLEIEDCIIDVEFIRLDASAGGISKFDFNNNQIQSDLTIDLHVSAGGINFDWEFDELDQTIDVNIEASAGGVDGKVTADSSITCLFQADVSAGGEDIPDNNVGTTGTIDVSVDVSAGGVDIELFLT